MSDIEDANWSELHDLALIYLALSHGTDLEFDKIESDLMANRLLAWHPQKDITQVKKVIETAMLSYLGEGSQHMVNVAIASLKESMDKQKRKDVVKDLADLATADGVLAPGEVTFIQNLAHYWEVDRAMN